LGVNRGIGLGGEETPDEAGTLFDSKFAASEPGCFTAGFGISSGLKIPLSAS
jgi:hypothetical protein